MTEIKNVSPSVAEMDLPLMANAYDIRARHYMLHLNLDEQGWKQQTFDLLHLLVLSLKLPQGVLEGFGAAVDWPKKEQGPWKSQAE